MTISLFSSILIGAASLTALLTQAIKQFYYNRNEAASPNIIALINAIVVGGGGTAVIYMLMKIPWTVNNCICLVVMAFFVWMGSMLGFSKILETYRQFKIWQESIAAAGNSADMVKKTYDVILEVEKRNEEQKPEEQE